MARSELQRGAQRPLAWPLQLGAAPHLITDSLLPEVPTGLGTTGRSQPLDAGRVVALCHKWSPVGPGLQQGALDLAAVPMLRPTNFSVLSVSLASLQSPEAGLPCFVNNKTSALCCFTSGLSVG